MSSINRQIRLAARPVGMPKEADFELVESPQPRPGPGEVLIKSLYLSVDSYLRVRIGGHNTYGRSIEVGEVIESGVVGQVEQSNDPRLAQGDLVEGLLGWQDYAVAQAKRLRRLDPQHAPVTLALSVLGLPGLTAYFGLLDVCRPQPGETVVISAAAGAVGSLVGQIARIKRCRAIGIAASSEKVRYLTRDLGFDSGFDYRNAADYQDKLRQLCPNGVDIYFDNVGGPITDAVMRVINTRARIAVCGQVSQYNLEEPDYGPRWMGQLVARQAKIEGFQVNQFADRFDEALKQLAQWMQEGRLRLHEDITEGLENTPKAFIGLLEGRTFGKRLVKAA
jgi:NADPH-dependent curcumin reductase CurA